MSKRLVKMRKELEELVGEQVKAAARKVSNEIAAAHDEYDKAGKKRLRTRAGRYIKRKQDEQAGRRAKASKTNDARQDALQGLYDVTSAIASSVVAPKMQMVREAVATMLGKEKLDYSWEGTQFLDPDKIPWATTENVWHVKPGSPIPCEATTATNTTNTASAFRDEYLNIPSGGTGQGGGL